VAIDDESNAEIVVITNIAAWIINLVQLFLCYMREQRKFKKVLHEQVIQMNIFDQILHNN
jgi:hypothetical protein